MKTLIIYHTKTGHTLEALNPFIESMDAGGETVKVVLAKDFKPEMLTGVDSFVVGTPCWGGSSGASGVAFPIIKAIKKIPNDALRDKKCGGIVVHAKYGGKTTLKHLKKLLESKGCQSFTHAPVVKAGTLGSVFKGKSVSETDEDLMRQFGKEFMQVQL